MFHKDHSEPTTSYTLRFLINGGVLINGRMENISKNLIKGGLNNPRGGVGNQKEKPPKHCVILEKIKE